MNHRSSPVLNALAPSARAGLRSAVLGCLATVAALPLSAGCGGDPVPVEPMTMPVPADPMEVPGGPPPMGADPLPLVTCAGEPDAGPKRPWRHGIKSPATTILGSPKHRGIDLIAGAAVVTQHLRGEISYGVTDKALEDEEVDLFACRAGAWARVGTALTDGEGRFDLRLSDGDRLPLGQRPLYASVAGDRSGVAFLGLVLPAGARLAVTDMDGTLTTSENAFPESLVTGKQPAVHDGAREALKALVARRYAVVYLTSRGRQFTEGSRGWVRDMGLPEGPMRLAPQLLTFPGDATVDYKVGALGEIVATGLQLGVAIGNRKSDGESYQRMSVPAARTLLKLPEFDKEVQPLIDRGEATGFERYDALVPTFTALPLGR